MIFAIITYSDRSNFAQEHLIVFVVPEVVDMGGSEEVSIAFDCIHAEC